MSEVHTLRKRLCRLSARAENRQKALHRINKLIKATKREPFEGVGKPEPLKHNLAGYWSRRINEEHRIVYKVTDDALLIAQLRYHHWFNIELCGNFGIAKRWKTALQQWLVIHYS